MYRKLSSSCRTIEICGITIFGCADTGVIIGLNDECKALVKMINDEVDFDLTDLTEGQRSFYQALCENGYFAGEELSKQLVKATLHVTSRCNLDCEGCYSYENKRNMKQDLSLDQIKKILDNLANTGFEKLSISGGEPFMHDDIIEILKYAKGELKVPSILCTSNGFATLETYMEASKYLDILSFSLDGFNDTSSTIRKNSEFASILGKMIYLRKHGVNVEITFTLHKKNLVNYDKMRDFAELFEIPFHFSIYSVEEFNERKSELILDYDDIDEIFSFANINNEEISSVDLRCSTICGLGCKVISIGSDGGIYPCMMFNGNNDFLLGNALYDKISDIITSENNRFLTLTVDDINGCKDCHIRYMCGGGCRFRGYSLSKNILDPDAKLCKGKIQKLENDLSKLIQR